MHTRSMPAAEILIHAPSDLITIESRVSISDAVDDNSEISNCVILDMKHHARQEEPRRAMVRAWDTGPSF
jgi:hypothetical protein